MGRRVLAGRRPSDGVRIVARPRRDERGVAIVTVLVIALVVFALGGLWVRVAVHETEASGRDRHRDQALAAAEAGINLVMSKLAQNNLYCPSSAAPLTGTLTGVGQFEVYVDTTTILCTSAETRRYIVARGWAPDRTVLRAVGRRLEQQVELVPTDGFRFALFGASGGITGSQNMYVAGDVYSADDASFENQTRVMGDIIAQGTVTVSNRATIGGSIHAAGSIGITSPMATVEGDLASSGGSITVDGWVKGGAQASSITVNAGGTIEGPQTRSAAVAPKVQSLPTFTWNPANYPSSSTWATAAAFQTYWSTNRNAFSGHHRVTSTAKVTLGSRWKMAGAVTIVTDGEIELSREIENASGGDVLLTIVSFSSSSNAINMTNQVTLPSNIKVALFAPNGCINFSQLKHFTGTVYGDCIDLDEHFNLTYAPVSPAGFVWTAASSSHFSVEARSFREVAFSP